MRGQRSVPPSVKIFLLLLAASAGAGFLLHDQLPAWLRQACGGVAEVYYLRAAQRSTNPDGTVVNWPLGQPLRTTTQAKAAEDAVALTDGTNILQVPRNVLTREANEAASLRQSDLVSQNAVAPPLTDVQGPQTYSSGTVATANAAPVYYGPVYVVTSRATPASQVHNKVSAMATPWPRANNHPAWPSHTPSR